jgi:hypothetical protein
VQNLVHKPVLLVFLKNTHAFSDCHLEFQCSPHHDS